jgi:hypothetical protein
MEPCVQSLTLSGPCILCGGRAQKMHRPLFRRGSFCPSCCPVCAAGQPASAAATPMEAEAPTQEAGEQKKAGGVHIRMIPDIATRGAILPSGYRDGPIGLRRSA